MMNDECDTRLVELVRRKSLMILPFIAGCSLASIRQDSEVGSLENRQVSPPGFCSRFCTVCLDN